MLSDGTGRCTERVQDARHQAGPPTCPEMPSDLPRAAAGQASARAAFLSRTKVREAEGNTRTRVSKVPEPSRRLSTVQLTGSQSFNQ